MPDPLERDQLPFFKDPKVKISIWTIIKDSIGKELSKISVPVYFNAPLGILQSTAHPMEFLDILDKAAVEEDAIKRMAIAGLYCAIQITTLEKFPAKPFNPLLGETYELVVPGKFTYLSEQVCHHPPVTAYENRGESGYLRYSTIRIKTSFSRGALSFSNMYKEYFEFPKYGEKFEFIPASKSIHNLIIGSPYLEVSGKAYLIN